jgi:hypothetical protein
MAFPMVLTSNEGSILKVRIVLRKPSRPCMTYTSAQVSDMAFVIK